MEFGGIHRHAYDTETDPSLGRSRRLVSAWLGLFLLLFNVVAGGALPPRPTYGAITQDHVIVCTVGGMAVVDRNGTPVAPDHAGQNGFCSYCLPLMHGAAIGTAFLSVPRPALISAPAEHSIPAHAPVVASPLRLALARAPPLV